MFALNATWALTPVSASLCSSLQSPVSVRGNELLKAKDLAGALAAYTEAIELDGSDAAFRSNRSAVYMSMKEYEKALVDAEVFRSVRRSALETPWLMPLAILL